MSEKQKYLATFSKEGRILIPKSVRKLLGITGGDQVVIKIVQGELHLSLRKQYLKGLQAKLSDHKDKRSGLTELSKMRKEDLKNE